jgi:hypothetical protein
MAFKKVYNKINSFNVFEKKLNGLVLYNKQYIRHKLLSNALLSIKNKYTNKNNLKISYLTTLDNNSFLFNINTNKNLFSGRGFLGNNYFFSHNNLHEISFVSIYSFRLPNIKNISIKLSKLVYISIKKDVYKIPLLILCPVRGGFKSYYLGLFGFIPFIHCVFGIKKFLFFLYKQNTLSFNLNRLNLKTPSSLMNLISFYDLNNLNLFSYLYKINFQISSIVFNYRLKYRKRLKYKNKKKLLKKRMNFVFLSKV